MYFIKFKFKLFVKPKKIEYIKTIISIGNNIKYAILFINVHVFKYIQLWKSSKVFSVDDRLLLMFILVFEFKRYLL